MAVNSDYGLLFAPFLGKNQTMVSLKSNQSDSLSVRSQGCDHRGVVPATSSHYRTKKCMSQERRFCILMLEENVLLA